MRQENSIAKDTVHPGLIKKQHSFTTPTLNVYYCKGLYTKSCTGHTADWSLFYFRYKTRVEVLPTKSINFMLPEGTNLCPLLVLHCHLTIVSEFTMILPSHTPYIHFFFFFLQQQSNNKTFPDWKGSIFLYQKVPSLKVTAKRFAIT